MRPAAATATATTETPARIGDGSAAKRRPAKAVAAARRSAGSAGRSTVARRSAKSSTRRRTFMETSAWPGNAMTACVAGERSDQPASDTARYRTVRSTAVPGIDDLAAEMRAGGVARIHVLAWRDLDDPDAGGSEVHADE